MPSYISGANITDLCGRLADNSAIDPKLYENIMSREDFATATAQALWQVSPISATFTAM